MSETSPSANNSAPENAPKMPAIGTTAPLISLPNQNGTLIDLASLAPKKVVIYFYPKDSTPGCTLEAQDFSRLSNEFAAADTHILGISKDSVASHLKFCTKQSLSIDLLSDAEGKICEAYGVWGEKKNYGKTYMGITRTTFLIDAEGKVAQIWPKVGVKGHAEAVLAAAQAL